MILKWVNIPISNKTAFVSRADKILMKGRLAFENDNSNSQMKDSAGTREQIKSKWTLVE
jgi:hypothetical protein